MTSFFSELFKLGIKQMLKAQMTDHLGYEKSSEEISLKRSRRTWARSL